MRKPIMVIGVGQCGGNIADIAEVNGFSTMAINSYEGDLNSLRNVTNRFHLTGFSGAGKNRENGKDALKENLEPVIEAINSILNPDIKSIMVAFSADGGTGSGSGPLLMEILTEVFSDIVINGIVVMPTMEESIGSLANASECLSEISNIEHIGSCLFVDNHKVSKENNITRNALYSKTNNDVVFFLNELCKASSESSSNGNFDLADMVSVISARGAMVISKVIASKEATISQQIRNSWDRRSTFITPEYDGKIINAALVFRTFQKNVSELNKEELFNQVGLPIEIYEGWYPIPKSDQHIITIISGLSFPTKRLREMEEKVNAHKERIQANIESSLTQKLESKSNWVGSLRSNSRRRETSSNQSISDRLKKFR